MNRIAWASVKHQAKAQNVSIKVAKQIWWQQSCKNAYSRLKYPVFKEEEEFVAI